MSSLSSLSPASSAALKALAPPAKLSLTEVTKAFMTRSGIVEALEAVTLEVPEGEFLVVTGPSGCGKSTLLNLVAGFEFPTNGKVLVDGKPVTGPGYDRMMMFQEYALFPWLNVLDNVMFGLKRKTTLSRSERLEVARYYLNLVRLERFEKSFIHELSGGMKHRVALARALAPNPRVLLIDEPFESLDALTRERLYAEIQAIFAQARKTVVFVTHNVREAACLGDRVVVLTAHPGRIKKEILIKLPRPRDLNSPGVGEHASRITEELKTEWSPENGGYDAST
jgi:NitT/TauT family transport system ATP-binding protein